MLLRQGTALLDECRQLAFGEHDKKHHTTAEVDAAFVDLPGLLVMERNAKDPRSGTTGWRIAPVDVVITGEN